MTGRNFSDELNEKLKMGEDLKSLVDEMKEYIKMRIIPNDMVVKISEYERCKPKRSKAFKKVRRYLTVANVNPIVLGNIIHDNNLEIMLFLEKLYVDNIVLITNYSMTTSQMLNCESNTLEILKKWYKMYGWKFLDLGSIKSCSVKSMKGKDYLMMNIEEFVLDIKGNLGRLLDLEDGHIDNVIFEKLPDEQIYIAYYRFLQRHNAKDLIFKLSAEKLEKFVEKIEKYNYYELKNSMSYENFNASISSIIGKYISWESNLFKMKILHRIYGEEFNNMFERFGYNILGLTYVKYMNDIGKKPIIRFSPKHTCISDLIILCKYYRINLTEFTIDKAMKFLRCPHTNEDNSNLILLAKISGKYEILKTFHEMQIFFK